jgi:hypothetical protein
LVFTLTNGKSFIIFFEIVPLPPPGAPSKIKFFNMILVQQQEGAMNEKQDLKSIGNLSEPHRQLPVGKILIQFCEWYLI